MRFLLPGGTSFAGRAIVTDALTNGAKVTLFDRGRTGMDLTLPAVRRPGYRGVGRGDLRPAQS
ncbi:MAG: hypothetical protein ABR922_20955, partial [Streptosporangiaceae bacterium]